MKITVLTLFPSIIKAYFESSIMKKAVDAQLIQIHIVNIRDYALDKHKRCDDEPYGGGRGMVLKVEPLAAALDACSTDNSHIIYPTPSARLFTQTDAHRLSLHKDLVFICGRYEGIDERIRDIYVDEAFSIGKYVISSGEIASMTIIDALYRLIEGVIHSESLEDESYKEGDILEYPQYTRPEIFRGYKVPQVLLSGNHRAIHEWRTEQSKIRTEKYKGD